LEKRFVINGGRNSKVFRILFKARTGGGQILQAYTHILLAKQLEMNVFN